MTKLVGACRSKLRKTVRRALARLYDKPLALASPEEERRIAELRACFAQLQCAPSAQAPPSERDWWANLLQIREAVLSKDPREFLRWHVISSTMFAKYPDYVIPELAFLKTRPDWETRWAMAIEECRAGHPLPYYRYPKSSANLIHHAYHVAQFESRIQKRVSEVDFIFEFGGGYGSMCRLIHRLGFSGKYVIFDLPGVSELQQFYLKSVGLRVYPLRSWQGTQAGVLCTTDKEELAAALSQEERGHPGSLFIATWSISETPVLVREGMMPFLHRFDMFLVAFQHRFHEMDNLAFFHRWKDELADTAWQEWEMEHMAGNSYLIGRRKTRHACAP